MWGRWGRFGTGGKHKMVVRPRNDHWHAPASDTGQNVPVIDFEVEARCPRCVNHFGLRASSLGVDLP